MLPPPATGIPGNTFPLIGIEKHGYILSGSPADWDPPKTIEHHRPLIFLDLDPFRIKPTKDRAGTETLLAEEDPSNMIQLSLIQNMSDEVLLSATDFQCSSRSFYFILDSCHSSMESFET